MELKMHGGSIYTLDQNMVQRNKTVMKVKLRDMEDRLCNFNLSSEKGTGEKQHSNVT